MRNKTVLISGASIAGPALAYWLHQYGFEPTVVEIAPALRPGGHAVDIRGTAARQIVTEMGILQQIRDASVPERGIAWVDNRGVAKSRLPAEAFGGESIIAEIEIMRGDLSEILYRATHSFTEYLFGDRITALDENRDSVKVTFASGLVRSFDLVVGADGVHSGVRALTFGPEEQFVKFLGGYTAYFTVPDPGDLDGWFLMYNEPGVCAGVRPERGGTAKAMLSFSSEALSFDRKDLDAQKALLANRFAGAGWKVPSLLSAMWDADDFYFDSFCQVHLGQWSKGRVVIMGDAAHCGSPLSGLGTSASIVGAYVLAGELASTQDDHESAFSRYQEEMKGFVAKVMELPPGGVNGMVPKSKFMIRLRNLSMGMVTRWPMRNIMANQAAKADAISLKTYR